MLSLSVEAPAPDGAVIGEDVIAPQEGASGGEEDGVEELVNSVE